MKVRHIMEIFGRLDPDANVGVRCVAGDDTWIATEIAIEHNGFGAGAEIEIVDTQSSDGAFISRGSTP